VKTVNIHKIIIPKRFAKSKPSEEKIMRKRKYFESCGWFDSPIKVEVLKVGWFKKHYILFDGYIGYLLAREKGLKKVKVECA
jgi:hypothetical protein